MFSIKSVFFYELCFVFFKVTLIEDTPYTAVSPPSVYWLFTIHVSGFVFVRSGRTSLRRSSFWDSCDTQTPSSIKAATWKTTLPGLVGAFSHHLVFYFRMLFLVRNPLFLWFSLSLSVVLPFTSNSFLSTSATAIFLLSFCKKTKGKLFLLVCWMMKRDRFSWSCILFQLVMEYCLGSASDLLEGKCVCVNVHPSAIGSFTPLLGLCK